MTPNYQPIFIAGCPRSGTTFLASLLGAAKDVVVTPESQFKTQLVKEDEPLDVETYKDKVLGNFRFLVWNIKVDRSELDTIDNYHDFIQFLVHRYAEKEGKAESKFWIDHSPGNILQSRKLAPHFPNAKFIYLVRDGRAVANSMIPLDWGPNTIYQAAIQWRNNLALHEEMLNSHNIDVMRVKYEVHSYPYTDPL